MKYRDVKKRFISDYSIIDCEITKKHDLNKLLIAFGASIVTKGRIPIKGNMYKLVCLFLVLISILFTVIIYRSRLYIDSIPCIDPIEASRYLF